MSQDANQDYVSRGGEKLSAALDHFQLDVTGLTCADLGSHVGGFVDCLLRRGASKVHSVDTSYGTLAWTLRKDPRVVVCERSNAMHVSLAEAVDLVTIDVGWTIQSKILPNVAKMIVPSGQVVSLIKPHYESSKLQGGGSGRGDRKGDLVDGVLPQERVQGVLDTVLSQIESMGWEVRETFLSPVPGHGGNREVFALLELRGG